ncbi:MAG: DsrE family protein [Flavobacteriales bacterium]|jgi:intracellular sulfur oxidation DsrE/DsrF family protein
MKTLASYLTTAMILISMALSTSAHAQTEHQLVVQMVDNNPKVQKGLIKQLNNLKDGYGNSITIEVVCHGPGLDLLHKERTAYREELLALKERGIIFLACENTLKGRDIPRDAIMEEFQFVPMGIGEVMEKQEQGWSYVKGGI